MAFAISHNGGKSQVNLGGIQTNGDYPFMNMMKSAAGWVCRYDPNGIVPDPDILDINGYPTTMTGGNGYTSLIILPQQAQRSGKYIMEWDGKGLIQDWSDGSGITGSFDSTTTGVGFVKAIPWTNKISINTGSMSNTPDHIRNIRFYHENDATEFAAGEVFGSKLRATLTAAKFGLIRFMDWQNNNTNNIAKWADNKALSFYSYYASEYRGAAWGAAKWYFGVTTNVASAYSISTTRGRAPLNGDVMQLRFNVDASATITAAVTSGANTVLTIATGGTNNVFNTVGESVAVSGVTGPWSGLNGVSWIVQARAAGSVTINFSSTGLPAGGLAGTGQLYHNICSLNVDGSGAVNITDAYAGALSAGGNSFPQALAYGVTGFYNYATLIYNSAIPAWIKQGGDNGQPATGISNATPPQLGMQLAAEVGAHPWFVMPMQAMDPMTDYVTQCATYMRDNAPSWMVPRFEPPNECFNNAGLFFSNSNCRARSAAYGWPASGNEDYVNVYGKFASTMGQDLQTVYGTGTTNRAKYVYLVGAWTIHAAQNPTNAGHVLDSSLYLAQVPPAQAGYNKTTAASAYAHGICPANYYAPSAYGTATEVTMASLFAGGDASQVPAYIATHYGASSGYNLARNQADFNAWKAIAQANGVQIMEFYEGGFSPDYDANAQINALKDAAKYHVNLKQVVADDYAICTGLTGGGFTGRFPSHYYLSGNRWVSPPLGTAKSVWALLDDIYETPGTAQWQAIVSYNAAAPAFGTMSGGLRYGKFNT